MRDYNTDLRVRSELEKVEREIGTREVGTTSTCPDNAEPYVTVGWSQDGSCIKLEGDPMVLSPTPQAAWALWMSAFREYKRIRSGAISWRKYPVLDEIRGPVIPDDHWGEQEFKGYIVHGRLHINSRDEGDGKG